MFWVVINKQQFDPEKPVRNLMLEGLKTRIAGSDKYFKAFKS